MKKTYLLIIAAMTNLCLLSAAEIKVGDLLYAINDSTRCAAVINRAPQDGNSSAVIIPDTIHYHDTAYAVTEIRQGAFAARKHYDCITLPKTIARIDSGSFHQNSEIDTIRFAGTPDDWMAKEWNPADVSRSYDLYIGQEQLTSLVIPEGTDTIKARAFSGCNSLTSVTIPASIRYIGDNAFRGVLNIIYHGNLQSSNDWGARWRNAYVDGNFVYPNDSMTTILGCLHSATGIVTVPDGVTRIEEDAFYGCYAVYSVTVPNSVAYIGDYAFGEIRNVEYHGKATGSPWGAEHMNYYAEDYLFYKDNTKREIIQCVAYSIDSIRIPNSVTKIRPYAFAECQYIGVLYVGNGMKKIGTNVFFTEGNIDSVIISDGVQSIDKKAFCFVRSMVLGASVKQLGDNWIDGSVSNIYSYAQSVPKASFSFFAEEGGIQLYVPQHMADEYRSYSFWRKFDIHTMDTTLISEKRRSNLAFIGSCDSLGLITFSTGDTLFRPIYRFISYSDRCIVVVDHDDHATAYNRHGDCLIPASQGYAEIVEEGINCAAWVGFKLDDEGEAYVYAVCNWKGEEIFLPKGKYSYLIPYYYKQRICYWVKGKESGKFFVIDSNENNCSIKNFPELTKFKYAISLPDQGDDDDEDDEEDEIDKVFTLDFIPQSPNPYPIKNYNKSK